MRPGRPAVGFDRLVKIVSICQRGATAGERSAAAAAFDRAAARTPYAGIGIEEFMRAIPRVRSRRNGWPSPDVLRRTTAIEAQRAAERKQFVEVVQHAQRFGSMYRRAELELLHCVGCSLRIGPLASMDALRLARLWQSCGAREAAAKVAAAWMANLNRPRCRR